MEEKKNELLEDPIKLPDAVIPVLTEATYEDDKAYYYAEGYKIGYRQGMAEQIAKMLCDRLGQLSETTITLMKTSSLDALNSLIIHFFEIQNESDITLYLKE